MALWTQVPCSTLLTPQWRGQWWSRVWSLGLALVFVWPCEQGFDQLRTQLGLGLHRFSGCGFRRN